MEDFTESDVVKLDNLCLGNSGFITPILCNLFFINSSIILEECRMIAMIEGQCYLRSKSGYEDAIKISKKSDSLFSVHYRNDLLRDEWPTTLRISSDSYKKKWVALYLND